MRPRAGTDDITVAGEAGDGDRISWTGSSRAYHGPLPGLPASKPRGKVQGRDGGLRAVLVERRSWRRSLRRAEYLLKGADGTDIITAVRAASAGQAVFGAALARRLRTWFAPSWQPQAAPFPQLTQREREILDGVAAGLTNAQIGQQMFLSAKTVANNVSNILAKLQLAERAQAIIAARDAGLGRQAERQDDGP